jgi:uncharacterized membrane protein
MGLPTLLLAAPGGTRLRVLAAAPGGLRVLGEPLLWSTYPILPWLELVTFGMAFGHWLAEDRRRAYRRALRLGGAFLLGFVVIRVLDGFGNIRPRAGDRWTDFFNPVKYPPSITFTLLTTGVNLILLGLFAQVKERAQRFLQLLAVYGRTPLFFYILHAFLCTGLAWALAPNGTTIAAMYPLWLLVLAILFPLCLWYGRLKRRQPARSVLRFL